MSITAPVNTTNGHSAAVSPTSSTSPTAAENAAARRATPDPAVVVSGVATQYWDEAIALPAGSPSRLWLLVDGVWAALENPGAANRDVVQRAFLGTDSTVRVWYDGGTIVGLVINGS
ncbi:MAG: hypothetical protein ABWZ98_16865, partial [Nakamurella sp.]